MHPHGLSIWLFIGIDLAVSGALITGTGIYELFYPPQNPVVLFDLHANVWWGALMLAIGLFYTIRFWPNREQLHESQALRTEEATWRS
jgi:hypothetical protein